MRRLIRFDHLGNPIGEVAPDDVISMERRDVINAEHSLEIVTLQPLEKNERIVYQDGRGIWHEYVIVGVDEEHAAGKRVSGTYYAVWSIMVDLTGIPVSVMPGVQNPVSATEALVSLLSTQSRWQVGTVTNTNTGGASMYDMSAWKAVGVLLDTWGGELSTTIEVSTQGGVVGRKVDLYDELGTSTVTRRFDFGADLKSVQRTFSDEPYYCRISPRGAGEQTGEGYGRKIRITEVNDGKDYLEYAPMVDVCKVPNGSGYLYPTVIIENSSCKTPLDLLAWAQGVLEETCTPKISYKVDVVQAGTEGVDLSGVSLGDTIHIVDRYFSGSGLRLSGRIMSVTVDELNERKITVTIGNINETASNRFIQVANTAAAAKEAVDNLENTLTADEYISDLLTRINADINATGGYTYITENNGIRTYDTAVSNPLVGSEASQVVEIKGGSIRIANSRTAQGQWDWRSVFTSGHISADLVNAVNVVAGRIQSANGQSYFDLDHNQLVSNNVDASGVITTESTNTMAKMSGGVVNYFYRPDAQSEWEASGQTNGSSGVVTSLGTEYRGLLFRSPYGSNGGTRSRAYFTLNPFLSTFGFDTDYGYSITGDSYINLWSGLETSEVRIGGPLVRFTSSNAVQVTNSLYVGDALTVNGQKHRLVNTDDLGDRLLCCYETPSPMFGDIGSGTIGEDGVCIVSIDDVFSETVRTDIKYQVFLQACGRGELWVDSKYPSYFVVMGEPGLSFDWEVKCLQRDYENMRLEEHGKDILTLLNSDALPSPETAYTFYEREIEEAQGIS